MARPPKKMQLVRLSVNLNQETAEALQQLAAKSGVSLTEMMRRCISVHKFVHDELQSGKTLRTTDARERSVREITLI